MKTEQIKDILFEHLDNTDEYSNATFALFDFEFFITKDTNHTYRINADDGGIYDYEVSIDRHLYDDILEDLIDFIKEIPFLKRT